MRSQRERGPLMTLPDFAPGTDVRKLLGCLGQQNDGLDTTQILTVAHLTGLRRKLFARYQIVAWKDRCKDLISDKDRMKHVTEIDAAILNERLWEQWEKEHD
jgi:hypothetical protein